MTAEEIRSLVKLDEYDYVKWGDVHVSELPLPPQQMIMLEIAAQLADLNAQIRLVLQHFRINSEDNPTPPLR